MASAAGLAQEVKLLLDEMHAPNIAEALIDDSWDVMAVAANPELRGMPDVEVLAHAAENKRALVTENIVDFATLAAQWTSEGKAHFGLIFINPRRFNRATIAYPGTLMAALRRFLDSPPIDGESWVWWL